MIARYAEAGQGGPRRQAGHGHDRGVRARRASPSPRSTAARCSSSTRPSRCRSCAKRQEEVDHYWNEAHRRRRRRRRSSAAGSRTVLACRGRSCLEVLLRRCCTTLMQARSERAIGRDAEDEEARPRRSCKRAYQRQLTRSKPHESCRALSNFPTKTASGSRGSTDPPSAGRNCRCWARTWAIM